MNTQKVITLGLCEGRHEMPGVDEYVFPSCLEVDFSIKGIMNLNAMAYNRMAEYTGRQVGLYVTGFSCALAAVIAACIRLEIPLTLWHYNRDNGEYVPQEVW